MAVGRSLAQPSALILGLVVVVCVLCASSTHGADFFGPCNEAVSNCSTRTGQIVFGGFFPVHEWNYVNNTCSATFRPESGFQRLEAMRWTIDNYDRNLDVGYDLRDTCSKDTNARDEALDFINVGTNCQERFRNHPISLVIGASSSIVSADLTSLLTLFDVPQISYAATSNGLNVTTASDQARFQRFFRTVPPDMYQVEAMVALLEEMDWRYVSIIYSNDIYGNEAHSSFKLEAAKRRNSSFHFCIAAAVSIEPGRPNDYVEAVRQLNRDWNSNATVVIVFAHARVARELFQEINRTPLMKDRIWIASDTWSSNVPTVSVGRDYLSGKVIGFEPYTPVSSEFVRYLRNTEFKDFPSRGTRGAWYREYFDYLYSANNYTSQTKAGDSHLFNIDSKVPFVIRATEIGLQAARRSLQSICGSLTLCESAKAMTGALLGQNLTETLRQSPFNASFDPTYFLYDSNTTRSYLPHLSSSVDSQRISVRYLIRLYRQDGARARFDVVGNWSRSDSLALTADLKAQFMNTTSRCATTCRIGSQQNSVPGFPEACCWTCTRCPVNAYINASQDVCSQCPDDTKPNAQQTDCEPLTPEYLQWQDPLAIVMIVLVVLALLVTTVVVCVFIKEWKSSLVRASSRELSTCLFIGFYLGCIITLLFITKPTAVTCALRRFGLSFVLTICFSALLVKTNRISRVFNRPPGKARPAYVSPEWQILFTSGLVLVQVLILVVWLIVQPPSSSPEVTQANERVQLKCTNSRSVGLYVSLAYNLLLMIFCTVYGVKTRKIPENFNEARYISFSMYTICTVWLGFIPAYLATSVEFEAGLLGLPLIINIVAMLGFLFVPKLYVILFDSDQVTGRNILSKGASRRNTPAQSNPTRSGGQSGRERSNAGEANRQASQ